MSDLSVYASIAVVHFLVIASPGPTFMVVVRHAVIGHCGAAFQVVLGVVAATLVWVTLAVTGLNSLFAAIGWLYPVLKVAAGAYLAWLGIRMLRGALGRETIHVGTTNQHVTTGWRAVRTGFATNISNPKVVFYYASLFGTMAPADAGPDVFFWAASTAVLVSVLWWSVLSLFFRMPWIRRAYSRVQRPMEAGMGILLIVIAGRAFHTR